MLVQGIEHVQIAAPKGSEDTVRAFYTGILGLKEIPKPEPLRSRGGVWFDCGNMEMHVGIDENPDNARSRRHVAFSVVNLEAVRRRLNENGIPIEEDEKPLEGVTRFYCRDSVGNRVEFWQGP